MRAETLKEGLPSASGQAAESRIRTLTAIREISQVIVGAFDLQVLLDRVVGTLAELSRAEACSIWFIDSDDKVRIKAAKGYHERLLATSADYRQALRTGKAEEYSKGLPIPAEYGLNEGLTGQIARAGEPVRTTGAKPGPEAHPKWKGKYDGVQWTHGHACRCFLGAPLKVKDHTIGIVKIENKREPNGEVAVAFDEEDEEVLTILANVIAVTIENQRLAEERRKQAEQAWRSVSARMAHKIGNQNFATKGFLRSLEKLDLLTEGRQVVDGILQCCEAINSVVNEAKKFSGPLTISKAACVLADFVERTVQGHPIADWHVDYDFLREDKAGPVVYLDQAQMRLVLMELLENSQGFRKESARVTIRTGRASEGLLVRTGLSGSYAVIDYEDNGPGIPHHRKETIFEPFVSFRHGSGLGLSIVRQIVEAHGGRTVECGQEGKGARFLMFLPMPAQDQMP